MSKNNSPIFRTQYSPTSEFSSESGSKLIAKYAMKIDPKTGYEYLAPTGEFDNVYDRIQADYPSTDINLLMDLLIFLQKMVLNVSGLVSIMILSST